MMGTDRGRAGGAWAEEEPMSIILNLVSHVSKLHFFCCQGNADGLLCWDDRKLVNHRFDDDHNVLHESIARCIGGRGRQIWGVI
jgi:hypothetical protein